MTNSPRFIVLGLLVALLAVLPFLRGLPGEFVFDDIPNIENNESIRLAKMTPEGLMEVIATPQSSGNMRGLPTLTFALDYWRAGGAAPGAFKATNLAIHAVTAFALAWLFRSILLLAGVAPTRALWAGPAFALAWALHPLQVSAVLYAVQRLQTMGTMFLVLALLAYLRARQAQMEGRHARTLFLVTFLLWALAMGCKEDSILLPAYMLALELTVLRFRSADATRARWLRVGFLASTIAGCIAYALLILPSHWNWDAYGGRDFSTPERLLTQARVLVMYLWQIVVPLPSHMPFYYDWLQPSRGLVEPWTTLPSILLLGGLLGLAWHQRHTRPLLGLGIFLFFAAHFITSNVIGLELAFEHRNHFALIGAVLAVGSLFLEAAERLRPPPETRVAVSVAVLGLLAAATSVRADTWKDNLTLARASAAAAPQSARAWIQVCATHFRKGGGPTPDNTGLDPAIEACSQGAKLAPYSLNNPALLIVLKTLRGDVSSADWDQFQRRLETVTMSWDNERAPMILTHHWAEGVKLDRERLLATMETLNRRGNLQPSNRAAAGYFVMNYMQDPDRAMPFFVKAIEQSPAWDQFHMHLSGELRTKGRPDLARQMELAGWTRDQAANAPRP